MALIERMSAFFDDMGETASVVDSNGGLKTGLVLFDEPDAMAFGDMSMGRAATITFATAVFPGLAYNDIVTIGTKAYRIEDVKQIEDGGLSQATLTTLDDA